METRALFWATLHDCVFKKCYSEAYYQRIKSIDGIISAFTLFVSAASVAAWAIWQRAPLVWSTVVMVAQTIQVIRPLLPYSKRIAAFNYILPEYDNLVVEIESAWHLADNGKSGVDYITMTREFKMRRLAIEHKYLGADVLPRIKRVQDKANQESQLYLNLFFNAPDDEGGEANAGKNQDTASCAKADSQADATDSTVAPSEST